LASLRFIGGIVEVDGGLQRAGVVEDESVNGFNDAVVVLVLIPTKLADGSATSRSRF
jgi:hypothetical protein